MFRLLTDNNDKKKLFNLLFYVAIIIFAILSIVHIFNSTGYILDTYEHIHASWLISEGLIPYRDFFEHHNPLLWYLFAPITKIFYRDVNIIFIARVIAVLGYFLTLLLTYFISFKYCKSSLGAKFSLVFILFFGCLWIDIQNLRPDIFMYTSILSAIIFIFKYLDNHNVKYLTCSYLAWFISFLFLQKALIYGLGFSVANIYLILKHKIKIKDIIISSILPIFLSALLLFITYRCNALENWYTFNFDFNVIMKNNFGSYHSGISPQRMKIIFIILSFFMVRYFNYSDKGIILISMWFAGFLQTFYFAPHPQYYFFNFLLLSILLTKLFSKSYNKNYFIICTCSIILLSISLFSIYATSKSSSSLKNEIKMIEYIFDNTSTQDVLPGSNWNHNLFNPNMHFHWLGLYTITMLADLYLDIEFDYNNEIKKHKPKLLFIDNYPFDRILYSNSYYIRIRNNILLKKASKGDLSYLNKRSDIDYDYWKIDMNFVKENYEHVKTYGNTQIWKRIDN